MTSPALVLVLLAAALTAAAGGWAHARVVRRPAPVVATVLMAAAGVAAALPERLDTGPNAVVTLLVVLAALLAVVGGGPVTVLVFSLVDAAGDTGSGPQDHPIDRAAQLLRGGAWIGALERAAVFASLASGLPEGIAIVLGLKGLGRYPELRSSSVTGAAERFIIGTFTSVLWAAGAAGVVLVALR